MTTNELLKEIKARLSTAYGERLRGVVLYGSQARGDAQPDSDVDVLVLLDGPIRYGLDLETNLNALYSLALQIGRRISAKPIMASEYVDVACPLYQNAHREGVAI